MNNNVVLKALYENRKQFLVINYRIHREKCGLSESQIYAISNDLYPFFDQSLNEDGEDDPYEKFYKVTNKEIERIVTYIDDEWLEGRLYDYYTLEQHFGGRECRLTLIAVLRYCYLDERFNEELWLKLVDGGPVEAKSITRELADWEV